jgi:hypothetical protein
MDVPTDTARIEGPRPDFIDQAHGFHCLEAPSVMQGPTARQSIHFFLNDRLVVNRASHFDIKPVKQFTSYNTFFALHVARIPIHCCLRHIKLSHRKSLPFLFFNETDLIS